MSKPLPPPRKRRPEDGRPAQLEVTPEITARVCIALKALCKHRTAANLAGIGLRTFYRWRRAGEADPNGPYGDFWHATSASEAEAQEGLSLAAVMASRKDGRLALDLLRARWPQLWPKEKQRLELSGKVRGELMKLSDEDLLERAEQMAASLRSGRDDV